MMAFSQDSISPSQFDQIIDLLVQVISKLDLDSDAVKLAYTLWSEEAPSRTADFQSQFDREHLSTSISLINYSDLPIYSEQLIAATMFQFIYSHAFVSSVVRKDAKKTVIFITSVAYEDENVDAAVYEASQVLKRGIDIKAIGVGNRAVSKVFKKALFVF